MKIILLLLVIIHRLNELITCIDFEYEISIGLFVRLVRAVLLWEASEFDYIIP